MNWLLRKYRLLRLKLKCYVLEAQVDHAEELLHDHTRRHRVALRELAAARRRLLALEEPEVLLRREVA